MPGLPFDRSGQTVSVTRRLPYPPEAVFDLVADIEQYPQFVPWCWRTRILERDGTRLQVFNEFGRGPLRLAFHTQADLDRPRSLVVTSEEAPFVYFRLEWQFQPAAPSGTLYTFTLRQKFRSALLEAAYGVLFTEIARAVAHAFERRARQRLGGGEA